MKITILHRFSIPQTDITEKDQCINLSRFMKSLCMFYQKYVNFHSIIYMYLTYFSTIKRLVY